MRKVVRPTVDRTSLPLIEIFRTSLEPNRFAESIRPTTVNLVIVFESEGASKLNCRDVPQGIESLPASDKGIGGLSPGSVVRTTRVNQARINVTSQKGDDFG
jgi:hypothetical protein